MGIKLGELILDDETAEAFASWLHCLAQKQRLERRKAKEAKEQDEREEAWSEKLVVIVQSIADRHGSLEDMDSWEQAKAACASWENQAGHFDVDEYFTMDDDWRELWHNTYSNRIREIAHARRS